MASLLGWLGKRAKAVEAQVNPFDNGRTYNSVRQNAPVRPGPSVVQQAAPIARPFVNAGKSLGNTAFHAAVIPEHLFSAGLGVLRNNQQQINTNLAAARQGIGGIREFGQGTAGLAYNVGQSVNPVGGDVYQRQHLPTGALEKFLLGSNAIPSIQKTYKDTAKAHGTAQAKSEAVLTALMAATLVKGAAKTAPSAANLSIKSGKAIKAYDQAQNQTGAVGNLKGSKRSPTPPRAPLKNTSTPVELPKIPAGQGAFTGIPKTPGAFKRAYQSINGVISQHGVAGREIASRLSQHRAQSEIGQEAFLEKIPTVGKLRKNDFSTFVTALNKLDKGEKVAVSSKIQKAIGEWNRAIPSIRQRAVKAGLEVGDLGPNYFPRQYKNLFTSDKKMAKVARSMVDTGKAKDLGHAIGKLQFMKHEYQRPFGNLESTRQFDLPGYEMNHEALTNYVSRSFDRITKAEQFGAKNETLKQLLGRAQSEGYNATPGSVLDRSLKIALGDVDKSTLAHRVSSGVRKFNALRSLSTAGISNATQLTNTATVAGFARTAGAIAKSAVSPRARAEARQAGVLLDHSVNELAKQGLGTGGKISSNVASPFFRSVEKFNRMATAIVGKDYGNRLARKGDIAQLRDKFGVTGEIGTKLTRDQEIQVSRKLVELTQFKVDPMDLPGWVDSPMGKLVAQFRTFGYKQTDFMYNQVLREATRGNFLPLARFVAIATPAGAGALALKGAIKGAPTIQANDSNASKVGKSLSQVGGFGLPGSEGLNIYNSAKYKNTPAAIVGTVGGPTASFLTETADNIRTGQQTGNYTKLAKEGVRSFPAVGPSIANRVFPKPEPTIAKTGPGATPAQIQKAGSDQLKALKENPYGSKLPDGVKAFGNNTYGLSDGRTAVLIDGKYKTYDSLDKAKTAKSVNAFESSPAKSKTIGEDWYYKTKTGKVSHIPVIEHQFNTASATNKLALDRADASNDLEAWIGAASKQYDALENKKSLYDPETEQDKIDALTLQQENLKQKADSYTSQGYIHKNGGKRGPAPGRKASTPSVSFKTASSSKAFTPKGIKVRSPAAPKFSAKTKKLNVAKIPSSYLNRKLA